MDDEQQEVKGAVKGLSHAITVKRQDKHLTSVEKYKLKGWIKQNLPL